MSKGCQKSIAAVTSISDEELSAAATTAFDDYFRQNLSRVRAVAIESAELNAQMMTDLSFRFSPNGGVEVSVIGQMAPVTCAPVLISAS